MARPLHIEYENARYHVMNRGRGRQAIFHTEGSLFRGRYKALLVDAGSYLLQVSRYVHRNPIETKRPIVQVLED